MLDARQRSGRPRAVTTRRATPSSRSTFAQAGKPSVGIDDDAGRMRPAHPAHREQRIVGERGPDPDDDGVDEGAQPMQMVETVGCR